MQSNSALTWLIAAAAIAAYATLLALTVVLWPLTVTMGLLLAALALLPLVAGVAALIRQRSRARLFTLSSSELLRLSDEELATYRLETLADFERRLELRELRLARRIRTAQMADSDYLDLLEVDPSDAELEALVGKDRQLLGLIDAESRLAFNRILDNRYAADAGVNMDLVVADIRDFVEKVARLYRPGTEQPLLETEIERMAKSFSSASLHMLMIVDGLPLNFQSYNTAKIYRLIRRGVSYYGTYKAFRPYLDQGFNTLQVARLALGFNPLAVGASWIAGKLAAQGARAVGEKVLQRTALQLLNDFIRVVGFEAAMMYGSGFQYRDANWVFAAALVNLEISRRPDQGGRDATLAKLCSVVLRNEFDRVQLLRRLARRQPIDLAALKPQMMLTAAEKQTVILELEQHCNVTQANTETAGMTAWRESLESALDAEWGATADSAGQNSATTGLRRLKSIFGRRRR